MQRRSGQPDLVQPAVQPAPEDQRAVSGCASAIPDARIAAAMVIIMCFIESTSESFFSWESGPAVADRRQRVSMQQRA